MMRGDTVSVVIPTRNRPAMMAAAVKSALAQVSPAVVEVIVVIDGPEEPGGATSLEALAAVADPRLRVLALEASVGGSEARNTGVRAASGDWIGFLDDDDLWLPDKIGAQLERACEVEARWPVLSCAVLARGPGGDRVWPRRFYRPAQPMSEYLFCRAGWTYGAGLLQTSTWLVPRALMLRLPFTPGLKKHQDWDWLLRATAEPGVEIATVRWPLVVFHIEGPRPSVGRAVDWRFSVSWAMTNRVLFTRKGLAGFLASECAPQAGRGGASIKERVRLFAALLRADVPSAKSVALCLGFLLVPQQGRRALRDSLRRLGTARAEF